MSNPTTSSAPKPRPEPQPYEVPPPEEARDQVWTYAQVIVLIQDSLRAMSPNHSNSIPYLEQWEHYHNLMIAEKKDS